MFIRPTFLLIAAIALLAPSVHAKSKQMACLQKFHECVRLKRGKMKECKVERDTCMKGDARKGNKAATTKKEKKTFSRIECSRMYADCRFAKHDSKTCRNQRTKCRAGTLEPDEILASDWKERFEERTGKTKKKEKTAKSKKKSSAKKKGKTKKKAVAPKGDFACYTINMAMENCRGHAAKKCKTLANDFKEHDDCHRCMTEYRLPMKLQDPFIFNAKWKMKTCHKVRKDLDKLKECAKKVKDSKERFFIKHYIKAQLKNDEIVADAKASGIEGCGNFSRMY